jgi:hypothetical protein
MSRAAVTLANKLQTLGNIAEDAGNLLSLYPVTAERVASLGNLIEQASRVRGSGKDERLRRRINDGARGLRDSIGKIKTTIQTAPADRAREAVVQAREYFHDQRRHWWRAAEDYVKDQAAMAREQKRAKQEARPSGLLSKPRLGAVVHFHGRSRRYLVVGHDRKDSPNVSLVALSGAERGSAPSGVNFKDLAIDANQGRQFTGKLAHKLRGKAISTATIGSRYGDTDPAEVDQLVQLLRASSPAAPAARDERSPAQVEADAGKQLHTQFVALASDAAEVVEVLRRAVQRGRPIDDAALRRATMKLSGLHGPNPDARRLFRRYADHWTGFRTNFSQVRGLGQPDEAFRILQFQLGELERMRDRFGAELKRTYGKTAQSPIAVAPPAHQRPTKAALEQAARIVHDSWHKYLEQQDRTPPGPYGINELDVDLDKARALGLDPKEEGRIVALVKREAWQERARKRKQRDEMLRLSAKAKAAEEKAARAEAAAKQKKARAESKIDRAALRAQVRFLKSALRKWTAAAEDVLRAQQQATLGHNHVDQQTRLKDCAAQMVRARDALETCLNRGMTQQPLFK